MYLCYIDESGTSTIPGNTSHFILAGVSIPIYRWRNADGDIIQIKKKYDLENAEIHTAWILRKYQEQVHINNFASLSKWERKSEVSKYRKRKLLELQKSQNNSTLRQVKKNYKHTEPYIHLTLQERKNFIEEIATCISQWGYARLFAECIDKVHFDPERTHRSVDEQAFEQVISRFEQYLQITDGTSGQRNYGLIVHDNNETVEKKHTLLMRNFHKKGTLWTNIERIIETPFFVDSQLTSMVQIADLCSYSLRRYLENNETLLFDKIYNRADRKYNAVVGIRHFTVDTCDCTICTMHSTY